MFQRSAKLRHRALIPATMLALFFGGRLGINETRYQPMKIAAAEGQWTTCQPCSFSAFQIGGGNNDQTPKKIIEIPHLLSVLATGTWNGQVVGLTRSRPSTASSTARQLRAQRLHPVLVDAGHGLRGGVLAAAGAVGAWLVWRSELATARWFLRVAIWAIRLPFVMNTAGWALTENGRQPWIVQGLQLVRDAVSPSVSVATVVTSLTVFVLLYAALGVVDVLLMAHFARRELAPTDVARRSSPALHFTY
jgi:cytochrome d ubiquinol oxidase subunit I